MRGENLEMNNFWTKEATARSGFSAKGDQELRAWIKRCIVPRFTEEMADPDFPRTPT